VTSETEVLIDFLDTQREHVLGILEGLSDEQLRATVLPSRWSALGMVQHLALDVEHYWVQCIVAGETLDFYKQNHLENAWAVAPNATSEEVFALYRREWEKSNEILRETSLDAPPAQRDEWWGDWKVPDARFIVLHMIEETACHAGHLDAVRELTDGRQWMVL
jgi:hypothetical protein